MARFKSMLWINVSFEGLPDLQGQRTAGLLISKNPTHGAVDRCSMSRVD